MTDCRDWLSTLWRASYKGFPFHFESDEEEGGLNPVIHKFPHRDDPYVEELGEEPRLFSGTAYVHGENADAQASAFAEVLASKGAGILVIPQRGPVRVHALPFRRRNDKDKLGLVAFEVKFVREGAATALISVPYLAQVAYRAADGLAAALTALFPRLVDRAGRPDYVTEALADGLAAAAAAVDVVRTTYPVDPAASAIVRSTLATLVADAADVAHGADDDVGAYAGTLIAAVRSVAEAMPAASAAPAMADLAAAFAPPPSSAAHRSDIARAAAVNEAAAARLARVAALTAYAEAMVRVDYKSRPEGVTARANVVARFDAELAQCIGAPDYDLYIAIQALRGSVVEYITRLITDLAPVVEVETARILPSLAVAWRLYADPLRGTELVARNAVRHPSFMPTKFAALAS